jgi:hypothetical protein
LENVPYKFFGLEGHFRTLLSVLDRPDATGEQPKNDTLVIRTNVTTGGVSFVKAIEALEGDYLHVRATIAIEGERCREVPLLPVMAIIAFECDYCL